jgi:hypothetical protein
MKSVMLALALLTTGCQTVTLDPISTAANAAQMVSVMAHAGDSFQERVDHLDRQLARLNKWCRGGAADSCQRAKVLEKEKADLLATNVVRN